MTSRSGQKRVEREAGKRKASQGALDGRRWLGARRVQFSLVHLKICRTAPRITHQTPQGGSISLLPPSPCPLEDLTWHLNVSVGPQQRAERHLFRVGGGNIHTWTPSDFPSCHQLEKAFCFLKGSELVWKVLESCSWKQK